MIVNRVLKQNSIIFLLYFISVVRLFSQNDETKVLKDRFSLTNEWAEQLKKKFPILLFVLYILW